MDPHEKVSMDAEKIVSNTWYFEFMVKTTFKTLARTTEFHITPLGSLKTIYVYSLETVKKIIIMRAYYFNCTLPKCGVFFYRFLTLHTFETHKNKHIQKNIVEQRFEPL